MNKLFFTLIGLLFTMLSCNSNRTESQESQENPESQDNKTMVYESNNPSDVAFGDPFILYDHESDTYYMYGTGGVANGFMAYSSKDLQKRENREQVYAADQEKAWGTKDFWAPEVY